MSTFSSPRRDVLRGLLWISPWIVGFVMFTAGPTLMSLVLSLTDSSPLEKPVYVGLDNYRELVHDSMFWTSVRNTLFYAVLAAAGSTAFSLAIAALLEARQRGAGIVRAIVFLPTLVPAVAACICWLWLFNTRSGLFDVLIGSLGLGRPDWLGSVSLAMPSLIVMSLWSVGSAVLVASAAMKEVPATLYDAAAIDGMSRVRRFWHVTVPMVSHAVLFNGIMSLIWSLQVFAAPFIMTEGRPDNSTYVYSMYVYQNAFVYGRIGYASALAWLQIVLTIALTLGVLRSSRGLVFYRSA